jgi:SAM-dependent methyltransferase
MPTPLIPSPFASVDAEDYDRLRHSYPQEAADWLVAEAGLSPGALVLDAGAGTGQASDPLRRSGLRVVAMEPAPNLRKKLSEVLPDVGVIAGVAERIPLRDSSLDAVAAGQSFQWFDGDRALPELHRVLRTGGALAILWIESDDAAGDLRRKMWEVASPFLPDESPVDLAQGAWTDAFESSELFGPFRTATFPMLQRFRSRDLADHIATSSDVTPLPADRRDALLRAVAEWSETLPAEVLFPMLVEVHLTFRRDEA